MTTYAQRVKTRAHKARQTSDWNAACRRAGREDLPDYKRLTPRQTQILGLVGRGLTNAEIASELGILTHTVVQHITATGCAS